MSTASLESLRLTDLDHDSLCQFGYDLGRTVKANDELLAERQFWSSRQALGAAAVSRLFTIRGHMADQVRDGHTFDARVLVDAQSGAAVGMSTAIEPSPLRRLRIAVPPLRPLLMIPGVMYRHFTPPEGANIRAWAGHYGFHQEHAQRLTEAYSAQRQAIADRPTWTVEPANPKLITTVHAIIDAGFRGLGSEERGMIRGRYDEGEPNWRVPVASFLLTAAPFSIENNEGTAPFAEV